MRHRTVQGFERTGATGRPSRKQEVPPKVARVGRPRGPRDWSAQNARLVDRGDVSIWVDLDALGDRATGPGAGRGCPYPEAVIRAVVVLATLTGLPLRQSEGLARFVVRSLGLPIGVPDYTTICRRRRDLAWDPPRLRAGQVIVIDATGVTVRSTGPWLRQRNQDPRRDRFVKLHAAVDAATGEVLAHAVTPGHGRGTGDVSLGPHLIRAAAVRSRAPTGVLADMAYDARSCYEAAREVGSRLVVPPKPGAVRGTHPDRDTALAQIGRIGLPAWKERAGYGQRSQVESVFGAWKKTTSDRTRAISLAGAIAEIDARVWLHNEVLARCPVR